jgi:RNA polymerase sigma-70 factor (ECF subfamily)
LRDDLLDDAVQDVFLVVQRKLGQFDGRVQISTWLYAIALRVARRYRERVAKDARRLVATESVEEQAAAALASSGPPSAASERLELARRALDALDHDKREAFVLACVEQMSAPEIAQVTGLPVNTVYSRIRAARQAFSSEVTRLEARSRWRSSR